MLHSSREPCPSDFYENKNLPTHSCMSRKGFPKRWRAACGYFLLPPLVTPPSLVQVLQALPPDSIQIETGKKYRVTFPKQPLPPAPPAACSFAHDTTRRGGRGAPSFRCRVPTPTNSSMCLWWRCMLVPCLVQKKLWKIDTVALSFVFDKLNIFQS